MPVIIACPSCGGKLRVPDALRGQKVRCPACHHTFDSTAEPDSPSAAPRSSQDRPLDLSLGEPSAPPSAPPSATPGLIGAIELSRSPAEPSSPSETPQPPPRRRNERIDRDIPDLRRWGPRRDAEPDRGVLVLSLGIISLTGLLVWCIPVIGFLMVPICALMGLAAWIIGQIDLGKMKRGQMDDRNRGLTQAGWICGILGVVLNSLMTLTCGIFLGGIWYDAVSRFPNTRPLPATRPAQPMPAPPPKRAFPPRNNPPERQF